MKGLIRKFKGKGIPLFKRIQSYQERRRLLLEDSAVQDLLLVAYNFGKGDVFTGVPPCDTGYQVKERVKEILI